MASLLNSFADWFGKHFVPSPPTPETTFEITSSFDVPMGDTSASTTINFTQETVNINSGSESDGAIYPGGWGSVDTGYEWSTGSSFIPSSSEEITLNGNQFNSQKITLNGNPIDANNVVGHLDPNKIEGIKTVAHKIVDQLDIDDPCKSLLAEVISNVLGGYVSNLNYDTSAPAQLSGIHDQSPMVVKQIIELKVPFGDAREPVDKNASSKDLCTQLKKTLKPPRKVNRFTDLFLEK